MPSYNGITTRLESQYDVQRIQEYTLPYSHSSNDWCKSLRISASPNTPVFANNFNARDHGSKSPVVDVHVPIYPNSQFWLIYHIDPDMLNHLSLPTAVSSSLTVEDMHVKYAYFKMLLPAYSLSSSPFENDKVKRTVSWGVGMKDEWKGKTMFGLFHGEHQGMAKRTVEKRGFWFSENPEHEGSFDIQIFRARGRRRTSRVFPKLKASKREANQVKLVNTGRVKGHHPQRYYQYALIDPVDEPYVVFRYHLRSMERLRALGIDPPLLCNDMTPRYWRPSSDNSLQEEDANPNHDEAESTSTSPDAEETHKDKSPKENESPATKPCESNHSETPGFCPHQAEEAAPRQPIPLRRHLSVPPTIRLISSSSFHEPHSPAKSRAAKVPANLPFEHSSLSLSSESESDSDSDSALNSDLETKPSNPRASADVTTDTRTAEEEEAAISAPEEICKLRHNQPRATETSFPSTRTHLETPSPTPPTLDGVASQQQKRRDATPPSSTRSRKKAVGRLLMGMRDTALGRKREIDEGIERSGVGYEVVRDSW